MVLLPNLIVEPEAHKVNTCLHSILLENAMAVEQRDIVIVGAGPTGLALAASLQRRGFSPLVLDRQQAGANTSRAAVIHARTLEVLKPLGVTDQMLEEGLKVPVFKVRDRGRILASVSFANLPTEFPFTLMYPQNRTEAVLLSCFNAAGGVVQRPCEVLSVMPMESGVEVVYKTGASVETVQARWLIGCDGGHSIVRQQSQISFEGDSYQESFILADVQMDWPFARDEVSLFLSHEGLMLIAPLPNNHFRIVATVQVAQEEPSQADFESVLQSRGPLDGAASIQAVAWTSRFRVSHRVAGQMRKGRILLAGDAAHVHSPAGGQGMNTGIQDAISLADALRSAMETGDEQQLEHWETKRLEIARSVVKLTDRMTRIATASSPLVRAIRNTVLDWAGHAPFIQDLLAEKLSELDNR
jgi:2-polyprenyl-6-methoxyphenol hydroxylase-like FAD-dependent oxidoreductase